VVQFAWSKDPEGRVSSSITTGKVSNVGQVEGKTNTLGLHFWV